MNIEDTQKSIFQLMMYSAIAILIAIIVPQVYLFYQLPSLVTGILVCVAFPVLVFMGYALMEAGVWMFRVVTRMIVGV